MHSNGENTISLTHFQDRFSLLRQRAFSKALYLSLFALVMAAANIAAQAQSATIFGSLGNFDVVNNTGNDAHGFEIELEGLQAGDVYYTFSVQRYGSPTIIPYATGVRVRWTSQYDASAQQFLQTTVAHPANTPFTAGTCYQWIGAGYATSGCEHFGVSLRANAIRTTYRWLIADVQTPGLLTAVDPPVAIPAPVYVVVPPAQPAAPPELAAEFEAPEPPEAPERYGDAQWVKIFKTQLNREVSLDELVSTNAIVPQDLTQVETAWDLVQASPPSNGNQRRHRNQGGLDPTTRAVVRRYETYQYTGNYDPVTHQATCLDLTCSAPSASELGDFISAQMTAANVEVDSVIVTKSGSGSVSSTDKIISCGSKCAATYNAGTTVTLVANPGSLIFNGWTGACTGTQLTCVVNVSGQTNVGASFLPQFTLSVGRSNSGTVTATPAGNDRLLNCGGNCSAKFTSGTTVTLTATPPAGKTFINWTGSGAGPCNLSTSPTCSLVITKDTSVQANFSK